MATKVKPIDAAPEWKKLSPYDQARTRTEMWLGSRDPHTQVVLQYGADGPAAVETTWVPAVFTAFREIFDNALDETAAHGNGDRVDVTYNEKTGMIRIADNGRGIPIEWVPKEKKYAATILLSEQFAGRNFEADRGETRGMNGVGGAIVNFTSESFQVEVQRDGQSFSQLFEEGREHVTNDAIIFPTRDKTTGTTIEFKLSKSVFPNRTMPEAFIYSRMVDTALCYPDLKLTYNGKPIKPKSVEKTIFPQGKPVVVNITADGFKSDFWLLPDFFTDGQEHAHSMVNAIPVFSGGAHIDTFRRLFFNGVIVALERESKKRKLSPNRSDFAEGMLIYNITNMRAPTFDGQSKTRLNSESVAKIITAHMNDAAFFKSITTRFPEWIDKAYEKCAKRTMQKDDAAVAALARKGKKLKVEKLQDATSVDRRSCILFLAEGDSAISGLNEARDPKIHGGLPLRGKIANVDEMSAKQAYDNDVLKTIMDSIGLVPGQRAAIPSLRYGACYITTDADEDGKNITSLLANFFYRFWPELFDPKRPFLFIFETPLIIAKKARQAKYWYPSEYHEFKPEKHVGWDVTRAKGLAALRKDDWKHVLDNPKVIPLTDDPELKESLDMMFSRTRTDDRKKWMSVSASDMKNK